MDDIISRICQKYTTEYTLLPPRRFRLVNFSMDSSVPESLQQRLREKLVRCGILSSSDGLPVSLSACEDRQEVYSLSVEGKEAFLYPSHPDSCIQAYGDVADAVCWTVYSIAFYQDTRWFKDWAYQNCSMVCKCFSARQQAAALRVMKTVDRQYTLEIPEGLQQRTGKRLCEIMADLGSCAPRYSGRPITPAAYERFRSWKGRMTLEEMAGELFPDLPYEPQAREYLRLVLEGRACLKAELDAARELEELLQQLPIAAISPFLTDLSAYADSLDTGSPGYIRDLLRQPAELTLETFPGACAQVDEACRHMIVSAMQVEFISRVIYRVRRDLQQDLTEAWEQVGMARQNIRLFCYLSDNCFPDQLKEEFFSWKQLGRIRERDLSVPELCWDPETFRQLQINLDAEEPPQLYLCPQGLYNLSGSLPENVKQVPTVDNQLFWAVWLNRNREEEA